VNWNMRHNLSFLTVPARHSNSMVAISTSARALRSLRRYPAPQNEQGADKDQEWGIVC
jgi:hypothetical protein